MEVPILPPDSLLVSPCEPLNLYATPREQGKSQLHNYICIEEYETSLQALRDWKKDKINLYKTDKK